MFSERGFISLTCADFAIHFLVLQKRGPKIGHELIAARHAKPDNESFSEMKPGFHRSKGDTNAPNLLALPL